MGRRTYIGRSEGDQDTIGAIEGAEDVLDSRLLVIKGSGATYVIGSKIDLFVQTNNPSTGQWRDLPRGANVPFVEVFLFLVRRAEVLNNWQRIGVNVVEPIQLLEWASKKTGKSIADLRSAVVELPDYIPRTILHMNNQSEINSALNACVDFGKKYEQFNEKLFEIISRR